MPSSYQPSDVLALIDIRVESRSSQDGSYRLDMDLDKGNQYDYGAMSFWRTLKAMVEGLERTRLGLPAREVAMLAVATGAITVRDDFVNPQTVEYGGEAKLSPVYVIQKVLQKCRPAESEDRFPELKFLRSRDKSLHKRLAESMGEAQEALAAHRYRSSTVVAVSVLEALVGWWLLNSKAKYTWPLDKKGHRSHQQLSELIKSCGPSLFTPDARLEVKDLAEIKHLQGKCEDAASLRNLIHPDKQVRTGRDIDAAAAHSAMGATLSLAQRIGSVLK